MPFQSSALTTRKKHRQNKDAQTGWFDYFLSDLRDPDKAGIIIEGDSWTSNPTYNDIKKNLQKTGKYAISFSDYAGKLLSEMVDEQRYMNRLNDFCRGHIKAMVLSGGGNDILREEVLSTLILKHDDEKQTAVDYLNTPLIDELMDDLIRLVKEICEDVWENKPGLPIVMHGYAYLIPGNYQADIMPEFPTGIGFGPWLYRVFKPGAHNVPEKFWKEIANYLVDSYNDRLDQLSSANEDFHHVDIRTLLTHKTKPRTYWGDEIHPNNDGFKKVYRQIHKKLQEVIPPTS